MKHLFFHLSAFLLFSFSSIAQLNEGGTPLGVKSNSFKTGTVINMGVFDLERYKQEDEENKLNKEMPWRFGHNFYTNITPDNSGVWTTLADGSKLWQCVIQSKGALSLNLAFKNFQLPKGALLYVYNWDKTQITGAFTSATSNFPDQQFGTTLISGDKLIVEYYLPKTITYATPFSIFRITHRYRSFDKSLNEFGESGACMVNINCPVANDWYDQKRSSVLLVSGGSGFCSGTLLNDVPQSNTPYVLTADHCGTPDGSWVFWFNYESPTCTNSVNEPTPDVISGAIARASNGASDFSLCEMMSIPPSSYNVYYSGWDRRDIPADSVFAIHHPSSDVTKFSKAANPVTTYNTDFWQLGQWTLGVTEGGSSGSALYNPEHRVIGQLKGGPSYCGASTTDLYDRYGKFSSSWNLGTTPDTRLSDWLDPNNSGVDYIDGYDPNDISLTLDAQLLSIIKPKGNFCDTNFIPVLLLRNNGITNITSCVFSFDIDGGSVQTYTWTGNLSSTSTTQISLGAKHTGYGIHTFNITDIVVNGNSDDNNSNDTKSSTFNVLNPTIVSLPISDNFESTPFPKTDWSIENLDNNETWERTTTASANGVGNASMYFNNVAVSSDNSDEKDSYITPYVTIPLTPIQELSFDVASAMTNAFFCDTLLVLCTRNCGITWERLYAKGCEDLKTGPNSSNLFIPNSSQWRHETIELSSFAGEQRVRFAIQFKSGWGNATYVDNINIKTLTSINELENAIDFDVYPNPSDEMVNVTLEMKHGEHATIQIINSLGQIVLSNLIKNSHSSFNIAHLPTGVYYVKLQNDKGSAIKKVIKY